MSRPEDDGTAAGSRRGRSVRAAVPRRRGAIVAHPGPACVGPRNLPGLAGAARDSGPPGDRVGRASSSNPIASPSLVPAPAFCEGLTRTEEPGILVSSFL